MSYCGPRGISHSHFLGGPPVWTTLDRDLALWWQIYDSEKCPSCGTREDEWDPDKGGHDHAYRWEIRQCWGCAEKASGQKKVKDDEPGKWVNLIPNPEV